MSKNLLEMQGKTLPETAPKVELNSWVKIVGFWGSSLFIIQKSGHIFTHANALKLMFGWIPDAVWEGIKCLILA